MLLNLTHSAFFNLIKCLPFRPGDAKDVGLYFSYIFIFLSHQETEYFFFLPLRHPAPSSTAELTSAVGPCGQYKRPAPGDHTVRAVCVSRRPSEEPPARSASIKPPQRHRARQRLAVNGGPATQSVKTDSLKHK